MDFSESVEFDLLLRASRMVCPATGYDGPGGVLVKDGRIAATGPALHGQAAQELDFTDGTLLPGLVDLHAHPARGGSKYGICPDRYMLPTGVTTVLSQGDAGALTWDAYREDVVRVCKTRVRLALNLSARGEAMPLGCFTDPADLDLAVCVQAVQAGGDDIWGISVNVSRFSCGTTDPKLVVELALEGARQTGKPLLYGPRQTADWPLEEQLAKLRSGDVVTYCFDQTRNVLGSDGRVHPAAREARARGVLFDVGHGAAAFDFATARAALADGFPPDTISSDLYGAHLGRTPRHDLPRALSILIETLGHETGISVIGEAELRERGLASVSSNRKLRLVDLTGRGLARLGADNRLGTCDIRVAQRWSRALHNHPEQPDGILYRSRHDPELLCAAVFERVQHHMIVTRVGSLLAARNISRMRRLLRRYDFRLIP